MGIVCAVRCYVIHSACYRLTESATTLVSSNSTAEHIRRITKYNIIPTINDMKCVYIYYNRDLNMKLQIQCICYFELKLNLLGDRLQS